MEVLKCIQGILPELTRTQTKVAEYILVHPEEVCFLPLRMLAEKVGVTETTILNFCKKTTYENYAGLKEAMRADMQDKFFWNHKLEASARQYEASDAMLKKLKENQKNLVDSTLEYLNDEELLQFVHELSRAERIYICGHEAALTVAQSFRNKMLDTGADVTLVDVSNYACVLDALTHAGEMDVFVLITLPFYAAQTVALSGYLASIGATVLALTDKMSSPIVKNATRTLFCNAKNIVFHNSVASLIALTDILASLYILENKKRFQEHNEKVKQIEGFFQRYPVPAYEYEYFYNEDSSINNAKEKEEQ